MPSRIFAIPSNGAAACEHELNSARGVSNGPEIPERKGRLHEGPDADSHVPPDSFIVPSPMRR